MKQALLSIYQYYVSYCGNSRIMLIYLAGLVYLVFVGKERRIKLVYPSLLMMLVILNPIFYKYIWNVLLSDIYWRMMWMIPVIPIIAVAATDIVTKLKNNIAKVATVLIISCAIVLAGKNIYLKPGLFEKAENNYKLPESCIRVSDEILKLDEDPVVIMPQSLFCYARQYSASIKQLYGRNVFTYISYVKPEDLKAFKTFEAENPDYEYIMPYVDFNKCEFIVQYENKPIDQALLDKYKFEIAETVSGFNIYHRTEEYDDVNKWRVTQNGRDIKMASCYTLTDREGHLIIIDGGEASNRANLEKLIECYDRHITAWILTNYNDAAVGAFRELMNNNRGIVIDDVYIPDIENDEFHTVIKKDKEKIAAFENVMNILENVDNVHKFKADDVITYDNLEMKAFYSGYKDRKKSTNAGITFIIQTENDKMLYCSNLTEHDQELLLATRSNELGDIKIMQLPRFGKNGWMEELYDLVNPEIAFLDISKDKFEQNMDEECSELLENLKERNVKLYYYNTYPNVIVMD